jgi:hypothetical protein
LSVSQPAITIDAGGGPKDITVAFTNVSSWEIQNTNSATWCTPFKWSQNTLRINCLANESTEKRVFSFWVVAGGLREEISVTQVGNTPSLQLIGSDELLFKASGETLYTDVKTNVNSWSVEQSHTQDWFTATREGSSSVKVTCSLNTETSPRLGSFSIRAGAQTVSVSIVQQAQPPKPAPVVRPATDSLTTVTPPKETPKETPKEETPPPPPPPPPVTQTEVPAVRTSSGNEREGAVKNPHRKVALSVAYVQKSWKGKDTETGDSYTTGFWNDTPVNGIQFGLRFDPYIASFGLGISTGVFYEYYMQQNTEETGFEMDYDGDGFEDLIFERGTFSEHSLYVPLHLSYRYDLNRDFGFVLNLGVGVDYAILGKIDFKDLMSEDDIYDNPDWGSLKRLNCSLEYGLGIQYKSLMLNLSAASGLLNHSEDSDYKVTQNKGLKLGLSYFF